MVHASLSIIVLAGADPEDLARTRRLAERLGAPHLASVEPGAEQLVAAFHDGRLELRAAADRPGRGLAVDFRQLDLRPGTPGLSRRMPLARAVGKRIGSMVDATAGLGQDAMLLAALGWRVTAMERSPILAALLEDGLERARRDPARRAAAERIELHAVDARTGLAALAPPPEVVYIDPMFPPRRKQSALPRKEIRLVRDLVGHDDDAAELVRVARAVATDRVVVKRPTDAGPLDPDPSLVFAGKLARYDVYLRR